MKKKQKIDFIIAIILIICGTITLLLPNLGYTNIKVIFSSILSIYAIANLAQFILTKDSKDCEGLYSFIATIIPIILLFILDLNKPLNIALILILWVFIMSLAKLKKADYYHDRKNKMWFLRIAVLFIFILIGLITSVNLFYQESVQVLLLGNFYFIHGVLELVDPIANYLMER